MPLVIVPLGTKLPLEVTSSDPHVGFYSVLDKTYQEGLENEIAGPLSPVVQRKLSYSELPDSTANTTESMSFGDGEPSQMDTSTEEIPNRASTPVAGAQIPTSPEVSAIRTSHEPQEDVEPMEEGQDDQGSIHYADSATGEEPLAVAKPKFYNKISQEWEAFEVIDLPKKH